MGEFNILVAEFSVTFTELRVETKLPFHPQESLFFNRDEQENLDLLA